METLDTQYQDAKVSFTEEQASYLIHCLTNLATSIAIISNGVKEGYPRDPRDDTSLPYTVDDILNINKQFIYLGKYIRSKVL